MKRAEKKEFDFETRCEELRNAAERVEALKEVFDEVKQNMEWSAMNFHDADEEHEERWFTAPDETSYKYRKYMAYMEVLDAITNLVD